MASNLRVILEILGKSSSAEAAAKRTSKAITGVGQAASRAQVAMNKMTDGTRRLGTGIRMIGQAAMSAGTTFTALISIPLAAAMRAGTQAAIAYEDALVRVQKTTGLTSDALSKLDQNLREIARYDPTPIEDLAQIGEVAGQMGFRAADAITVVVEQVRMLAVATDLTAESSARSMGKISSAFGYAGDKGAQVFGRLATTVNALENQYNATAAEIVQATLNMASGAHALGLSMAESSAMATTLVAAGVGARMAGTELNRFFVAIVQNIDEVAQLLGTSVGDLRKRLDRDANAVILELLERLSALSSGTDQLRIGTEIFGIRAGKAIGRLAANYDQLVKAQDAANQEWQGGTSLLDEFHKATQSSQQQLAILRNNLRVAAIELGENVLPKIVEFVKYAVPAIQKLVSAFVEMPPKVQMIVFVVGAFIAVLGPLILLLGSVGFSLGLLVGGIVMTISGMMSLVGGIAAFLTTGWALIPMLAAVAAAIATGLVFASEAGQRALEQLASIIDNYIQQAESWGEGLASNIAVGLLAGIRWIVDACIAIGEVIAGFFAAASPPKMGPLSQIGEWGKRLIDTYLQAFGQADFKILNEIGGIISGYFEDLATAGKIGEKEVVPAISAVRESVAEILAVFNKTGTIAEDKMGQLKEMLGEAGDEVERLLRLQLEYNQAGEVLKGIKGRKKAVGELYQKEVAAIREMTGLTDEQRRQMIWQANARARAAEAQINADERQAKDARANLEDQIGWQKNYIGGLQDTDALYVRQAKLLDKLNGAMRAVGEVGARQKKQAADRLQTLHEQLAVNRQMQKEYAAAGLDTKKLLQEEMRLNEAISKEKLKRGLPIEEELGRIEELKSLLADGYEPLPDLASQMQQQIHDLTTDTFTWGESVQRVKSGFEGASQAIDAFLAAIRGERLEMPGIEPGMGPDPYGGAEDMVPPNVAQAYEMGAKIRETWSQITGIFSKAQTAAANLGPTMANVVPEGVQAKLQAFGSWWREKWPFISAAAQTAATVLGAAIRSTITVISETVLPKLKAAWGALKAEMGDVNWISVIKTAAIAVGVILLALLAIVIGVINGIASGIETALVGWHKFREGVREVIAGLKAQFTAFGEFLTAVWEGRWEDATRALADLVAGWKRTIRGMFATIEGIFTMSFGTIINTVLGFVEGVVGWFKEMKQELVGGSIVPEMLDRIIELFVALPGKILGALGSIAGKIGELLFGGDMEIAFDPAEFLARLNNIRETIKALILDWQTTALLILESALLWVIEMSIHFHTMRQEFVNVINQMTQVFRHFIQIALILLEMFIKKWRELLSIIRQTIAAVKALEEALKEATSDEVLEGFIKLIRLLREIEKAAKEAREALRLLAKAAKEVGPIDVGGGASPSVPGAQGGMWNVARDMLVRVHRGEAILPADVAGPFRGAALRPLAPTAPSGMAGRPITINIDHPVLLNEDQIEHLSDQLIGRLIQKLGARAEIVQRSQGIA